MYHIQHTLALLIQTHHLKSSSNDMRFFIERKIKVSTRLNFNPSDLERVKSNLNKQGLVFPCIDVTPYKTVILRITVT